MEKKHDEIRLLEEAQSEFISMVEKVTSFANKIFVTLNTSAQLKKYAHQFNQYYIKFTAFIAQHSDISLPTKQISHFDIQEQSNIEQPQF